MMSKQLIQSSHSLCHLLYSVVIILYEQFEDKKDSSSYIFTNHLKKHRMHLIQAS